MTPAPFYDDGQVTIYCADLRDVDVPAGSVAAVVTSPPYNVGPRLRRRRATRWRGRSTGQLARRPPARCARALVEGGRAWVNTAVSVPETAQPGPALGPRPRPGSCSRSAGRACSRRPGSSLVDQVAWCSPRGAGTAWGSWESPTAPNLRGDWESILVACRPAAGNAPPPAGWQDWRDGVGGWASLCSTVWNLRPEHRTGGHPAPFPRRAGPPGDPTVDLAGRDRARPVRRLGNDAARGPPARPPGDRRGGLRALLRTRGVPPGPEAPRLPGAA